MVDIDWSYSIKYLSVDDFLEKVRNIRQVKLIYRIFTKKGVCYHCNGKMTNKTMERPISNDNWSEHRFKFDKYCDCCGALYFKYDTKLLLIIDESIINLRKAKINRLMNRKK